MKVYIVWSSVHYDGLPLIGVCVIDNGNEKDETGMPKNSRWMFICKNGIKFNLYNLTDEEICTLKEDRILNEKTAGKIINHDLTYSGELGEPYSGLVNIPMFKVNRDSFEISIDHEDIINPQPYQLLMDSQRTFSSM